MKTIREQFGNDPPIGELLDYESDFRLAKNRTSEIEEKENKVDYEQGSFLANCIHVRVNVKLLSLVSQGTTVVLQLNLF